ncbi:hypothetical protein Trydic_g21426 [Trypoxylus dichotomus]
MVKGDVRLGTKLEIWKGYYSTQIVAEELLHHARYNISMPVNTIWFLQMGGAPTRRCPSLRRLSQGPFSRHQQHRY